MAHSEPSNGNHPLDETAVLDALREAIDQQNALPTPYIPPETEGTTPPAEPTLYSHEWFTSVIGANENNLRQQQANVVTFQRQLREAEDATQRIIGVLDTLRALQKLGEA